MTPREICLESARRPGGVRAADLPMPRTTAASNFRKLMDAGLVFRAGVHYEIRYFTSKERAQAFGVSVITAMADLKCRRVRMTQKNRGTRAGWGPDDPARITSKTKVTIVPTPPQALYSNTHSRF